MNAETGIINIRGKQYQTVAYRVHQFREDHPDWSLTSDMIERTEDCVVMRAMIANHEGRVLATGFAEEYRKSSTINKTSALENAETSAIGRALAALGYGGTEYATANEVHNAIHQQGADEGHSQQGAVSPPVPDAYPFPPGPASGITQLKAMVRPLWREIKGCGDDSELDPLLAVPANKAIIEQCMALENPTHRRELWEGDGKDNPGLDGLIRQMRDEFAQRPVNILQAG